MSAKVISEPANAGVDIVLVHGWYGEEQPWTRGLGKDAVCWPESILPALAPQARIVTFIYNAKVDSFWAVKGENDIDTISEDLLWELQEVRSKTKTTKRPVIFVAHSIGGLVCENALVRASNGSPADKELVKLVQRFALIGTPFHANKGLWAKTGEKFFQLCGSSSRAAAVRDEPKKSEKLAEIGENFRAFVQSRTAPGAFEVACFYEGVATKMGKTKVVIADEFAVRIPGCPNPSRLEANHQGMAEAASRNDAHFKRLSRVLVKWAEELGNAESDDKLVRNQFNATFHGENRGFQLGQNTGTINDVRFGAEPAASTGK